MRRFVELECHYSGDELSDTAICGTGVPLFKERALGRGDLWNWSATIQGAGSRTRRFVELECHYSRGELSDAAISGTGVPLFKERPLGQND
jgi:hypothetical protein